MKEESLFIITIMFFINGLICFFISNNKIKIEEYRKADEAFVLATFSLILSLYCFLIPFINNL